MSWVQWHGNINLTYIGTETFSEWDIKHLFASFPDMIGIYNYYIDWYDWGWYLIGKYKRKWYAIPLGHCSCYWPLEDCSKSIAYNKKDILKLVKNMGKYDANEDSKNKFIEFITNH